ncbi:MAG: hypothetical protein J0H29_21865 [Sphingobacteriales bacterium]|nr:hypothetical protein [Sphingobacteriales bacterium]OJY85070.1 MAG: hypothetical protein BGP14_04290 [Sphingobacteriales bacterium 44-15]
MRQGFLIFTVSLTFILFGCDTNEAVQSDKAKGKAVSMAESEKEKDNQKDVEKVITTKNFLDIEDLVALITTDNLNSKTISNYLNQLNKNWRYEATDNEGIYFIKDNDETTKELLIYHYKKYILEYLSFSKNHFFEISKGIKKQNFEILSKKENEYGGQVTTYSSGKIVIFTEEIPLTEPGKSGFKIAIAQKR